MTKITLLKLWMRASVAEEQEILARECGTTRAYLYQLAGGFRTPNVDLAAALEKQTEVMHKASGGRLPRIFRTDLVTACAQCPYAHKCLGADAVRAEFEIVTPEMVRAASVAEADSEGGEND